MSVAELAHEFGEIPCVLQELIKEHMPLGNAVYLVGEGEKIVKDVPLSARGSSFSSHDEPLIFNQWKLQEPRGRWGRYKIIIQPQFLGDEFVVALLVFEEIEDTLSVLTHSGYNYILSIAREC